MEKEQISFFDFQGRYGKEEYSSLREKGSYYPERLEQGCMGFRKSLLEKDISPYGLHFFDCASMHFLTKFFLERLREDFILLLFDHQADLKRREARALCHNSWLRQVMVRLPHCRGILLLGATEEEKGIIIVLRIGIFKAEEPRPTFLPFFVWCSCLYTVLWIRTFSEKALQNRNTVSLWIVF